MYDLGYIYQIKDTKIWNYNTAGATADGFRNTNIDYSLDGINWTTASTITLPQASGNPNYTGYMTNALSGIQARYVLFTANNTWGTGACAGLSEVRFEVEAISLSVKAFLQGAYDATNGLMSDNLRENELIPLQEPYTLQGYLHAGLGGEENTENTVLNVQGKAAVVDWVVLELRSPSDASEILASRSCLLLRDGRIVDVDGFSDVTFSGVDAGNYYVAVRHRNHLAAMTKDVVNLGD